MIRPLLHSKLTSDRRYFYLAQAFVSNPTIYKMDTNGAIIESYTTSKINSLSGLTWAAIHKNSELWVIDGSNSFEQIVLGTNTTTVVHSFEYKN